MWDRDDLLARTDLPALLDELSGPAVGHGRSARWHCPASDHDDTHPSVTVFTDRRGVERWTCWSGGHAGTAIDALTVSGRASSTRAALDRLAERAGVTAAPPMTTAVAPRSQVPSSTPPAPTPSSPPVDPVPLHPGVEEFVAVTERMLWSPAGATVRDYLINERRLDPDVLRLNRVGADPGPERLRRTPGIPAERGAVVLPVLDPDGDVVYLQTRTTNPAAAVRYRNLPARLGSNPALAWTRSIRPGSAETLIACEGQIDAYTAAGLGHRAVALLGTGAATPATARTIAAGHPGRIVLALDADEPGRAASERLATAFTDLGRPVMSIPLPAGSDLNSVEGRSILAARLPGADVRHTGGLQVAR